MNPGRPHFHHVMSLQGFYSSISNPFFHCKFVLQVEWDRWSLMLNLVSKIILLLEAMSFWDTRQFDKSKNSKTVCVCVCVLDMQVR